MESEEEEEEEVVPPLIQSRHGRGPATSGGIEVTEGPQLEVPLTPLITSGEGSETQLGFPSVMMPTLKVIKSSPNTGPIGGKAPIVEASLVQVSSSSSEGDDHDIGPEFASHDASESVHVVEEEMQATSPEAELPSKEIATAEGIFSFPFLSLPVKNIDDILILYLNGLL